CRRPMTFSSERWAAYLAREAIPWPRLPSGALALDEDTFREMARAYPTEVGPIRELRHALSQLRLQELAVGPDGRTRVARSAFGSRTGRNQPSNSRFIFGASTWRTGSPRFSAWSCDQRERVSKQSWQPSATIQTGSSESCLSHRTASARRSGWAR